MSAPIPYPRLHEMSVDDLRHLAHRQHLLLGKALVELDRVSGRLRAAEAHYIEQAEAEGYEGDNARAYRLGCHIGLGASLGHSSHNMAEAIRGQLTHAIDITSPQELAHG